MASKEFWTTSKKNLDSPKKRSEESPGSSQQSTSQDAVTPRAGPKSWKRKIARAREEKTFAHVDDLLMSDSGDELEDRTSATDNLNETDFVESEVQDIMSDYSDEFEVDDLGSSNLINQPLGQGKPAGTRSECRICSQILPSARLAAHEALPHPVPCTQEGCGKMFILEKTLERHLRRTHTPKAPTPTLISSQLSGESNADVGVECLVDSNASISKSCDQNEKPEDSQNEGSPTEGGGETSNIMPTATTTTDPCAIAELDECHTDIQSNESNLICTPESKDKDEQNEELQLERGPRVLEVPDDDGKSTAPDVFNENLDLEKAVSVDNKMEVEEMLSEVCVPEADDSNLKVNEDDSNVKGEVAQFEEPPGPYICKFCKEEYKSWATLTRHFITPHLFKCEFCDLVFNRRSVLEDHTNMLHDLVGLIDSTHCGLCGETFSRSSTLARHISAPHNFPCKKCEKKFQAKAALNKHNQVCPNKHLVVEEEEEPEKKVKKGRKRNAKKNTTNSGTPPKKSKQQQKSEELVEDEYSDSDVDSNDNEMDVTTNVEDSKSPGFSQQSDRITDNESSEDELNLSQRLKGKFKKIKEDENSDQSDGPSEDVETSKNKTKKAKIACICSMCDQTINGGPRSLKRHQSKDHKFPCSQCDKKFLMKSRLKAHQENIHKTEIYEFECKLCQYKLFSGTKISMTLVKNKIEKHKALTHNFSCDECSLKFVSGERLSYHKSNNHGTEFNTDYHCKKCDRIIENKDENKRVKEFLDHNETVHSFSCDYCLLKFITSLALKKHSEEAHKNETHCHKCKIEFSQEELHKHVKIPHPFDCDECDFHFITEERLKYHTMNLHDREETIETICSECNSNIGELEDFLNHIEIKHREECDECSLSFIDEISLNNHVKSEHPRKELTCCQCGKDFGDVEVEYEKHIEVDHKYNCNFCDKKFVKKSLLLNHINAVHGDLEFICKFCGKCFQKAYPEYQAHEEERHDFSCRYCDKKFIKRHSLINHVKSDHTENNFVCKFCSHDYGREFDECLKHEDIEHEFKCDNCDKSFVEKSVHDKHSLDVHGVSVGLDLKCGQCQERFSNTGAFREHFKVPHKVFCSLCDLKFPSYNKLNDHLSKSHQKSAKAEKLICKFCGKKFEGKDKNEFEDHQNMKHKYKCDNCEMMFVKSGRLRDHIDELHGHSKSIDDKFTCKLCRTVCNRKNDIKLSKESYKNHCSQPHKFPCRSCDLRFINKTKLDSHVQESHENSSGVSANECPICGSRFSDLHKLKDHKKEPHLYNCKDKKCKKRFVAEVNLEKHLQRKHKEFAQATFQDGQILFRCKLCSKSFDSNLALQSHQYVKHSYKCHLCESSFTEKDELTIHLVRSHRVNKIPMAGFRCKLCKLETKKMVEIRKHLSLNHKYNCSFCKMKYTNKNQLDVHMEENHMDQVMMSVVGGDKPIDNDEATEKQPYITSLGVNVLLWAGSKQVVKHLHKVMEGQTSSNRHKLFMNKQEREECCRSEDSKLYKLSSSRFMSLPTPTDQALIEVTTETYRSGQPILHGISNDKFTFEYVTCVLIPETWILYLRKLKGLSSEEAEKVFVAKVDSEKFLSSWKDFESVISKWKVKDEKIETKGTVSIDNEQVEKREELEKKIPSDPSLSKSSDPRKSKSLDPRMSKLSDPRINKGFKTSEIDAVTKYEKNENNDQGSSESTSSIADTKQSSEQSVPSSDAVSIPHAKELNASEVNDLEKPIDSQQNESVTSEKVEAEELDTIAQFLETSG